MLLAWLVIKLWERLEAAPTEKATSKKKFLRQ
jgi:hypothetical protein